MVKMLVKSLVLKSQIEVLDILKDWQILLTSVGDGAVFDSNVFDGHNLEKPQKTTLQRDLFLRELIINMVENMLMSNPQH